MAQFLRPDADVGAGLWTTAPLWSKVDEAVASDADLVTSNNNASPDTCELGLTVPAGTPGAGTVTLRIRRRKSASGGHTINGRYGLYRGTTLIQEFTEANVSEVFATSAFTISNPVSDWSDLRVRISREGTTGGSGGTRRSLQVSFVELEAPDDAAPARSGSGSLQASAGVAAAAADVVVDGDGGAVAATAIAAAAGTAVIGGAGGLMTVAAALDGAGAVGAPEISGAGAMLALGGVATASAQVLASGSGSGAAPAGAIAGDGRVAVAASGVAVGMGASLAGAAAAVVDASAAAEAPIPTASGSGATAIDGAGAMIAAVASIDGLGQTGEPASSGAGVLGAAAASLDGSGSVVVDASGSTLAVASLVDASASAIGSAAGALVVATALVGGAGDVAQPDSAIAFPLSVAISRRPRASASAIGRHGQLAVVRRSCPTLEVRRPE